MPTPSDIDIAERYGENATEYLQCTRCGEHVTDEWYHECESCGDGLCSGCCVKADGEYYCVGCSDVDEAPADCGDDGQDCQSGD